MPIKVPDNLPAKDVLISENIFVINETRAYHQDIRPLDIVILNLMPIKQTTEVQLLRALSNTPLQIDVTLMHMESHVSKNTSMQHLDTFYKTMNEVQRKKFDGMIITGAPIELLDYEKVSYWKELTEIMSWTAENVTSTFHICWGAQAGLYYHHNIPKYPLDNKMFGIFPHYKNKENINLLRGFDDVFYAPHSRHTEIKRSDIDQNPNLETLIESDMAGVYLVATKDGRQIFCTGHSEYDYDTLKNEYFRDLNQGLDIQIPHNYFPNDDPYKTPLVTWRSHASLMFSNWLNYYVYQETPYDLYRKQD